MPLFLFAVGLRLIGRAKKELAFVVYIYFSSRFVGRQEELAQESNPLKTPALRQPNSATVWTGNELQPTAESWRITVTTSGG